MAIATVPKGHGADSTLYMALHMKHVVNPNASISMAMSRMFPEKKDRKRRLAVVRSCMTVMEVGFSVDSLYGSFEQVW